MDFPTAIEKYWTQAAGVAAAIGALVKLWMDARAKKRTDAIAAAAARHVAKLDLAKLVREETAELIHRLREDIDQLRAELRELQTEHIRMIADKDAEIALLRGRNRQLEATIAAHRRHMLAAGLELPPEPAFFELRDGELTPMGETP